MPSAALALVRISSSILQSTQIPGIRPYVLRFIAQDYTRSKVSFSDRDERDERGAQFLALGAAVTLATVRGAA